MVDSVYINLSPTIWRVALRGKNGSNPENRVISIECAAPYERELKLSNGTRFRDLTVNLSVLTGEPRAVNGNALARGVGILAYAGATKGGDDYGATEPFINGWFYVSDSMFDELLSTLRAGTAKDCSISLTVGPVSYETLDFVWDLEASPHLSVDSVEFNFTYRKDEEKPEASLMQRLFGS